MALRFAADTGGTFTDLIVEGDERMGPRFYKRPTTPDDPTRGLLDVLSAAAEDFGTTPSDLLGRGEMLIFGTTRPTNAIVEGATARTALLVTSGHPDILLLREGGGRTSLFDYTQEYPRPYVPRALTFAVRERIGAHGDVVEPLDEDHLVRVLEELRSEQVEAIAVCLLWSVVNGAHEIRVGELIGEHLPDTPYTLSHALNPTVREYRRASSAAIDASLKPLMSGFFAELESRLRDNGFDGRLLIMTSAGGVKDAAEVRDAPIHSIGSGPAAAPVAGGHFAQLDAGSDTAIVSDAGGTTYDVSLVRDGHIPWTRQTMVGHHVYGYMTGFPSVDVKSIGAGGGSIASVDDHGLLHVGPQSAGADPGPACYARGGDRATVTDACVVLGYIDPDYFLGGEMALEVERARAAVEDDVARPLGMEGREAAEAILRLACEQMTHAIEEITLNQGIDPRSATMIAGGGGAGLYAVTIARRLGCRRIVLPEVAAALSASGALLSDLQADYAATELVNTASFDRERANAVVERILSHCEAFAAGPGARAVGTEIGLSVEARYPHQVWEIEVPLRTRSLNGPADLEQFLEDFHRTHEDLFAFADLDSPVEIVTWRARARCNLGDADTAITAARPSDRGVEASRLAFFPDAGEVEATVHRFEALGTGRTVPGPALVESPVTTVVVPPGATVERAATGSLLIEPGVITKDDAGQRLEYASGR